MISGVVSASREATVRLVLYTPDGRDLEVEFVIDTGFNGWLSLPSALVSQLDLPWRRRGRAELADGSGIVFDIYATKVVWNGKMREVSVDEIDSTPLIGMSLLDRHELTIQVWPTGNVSILAVE
jgi:clan AA aspartic protease